MFIVILFLFLSNVVLEYSLNVGVYKSFKVKNGWGIGGVRFFGILFFVTI